MLFSDDPKEVEELRQDMNRRVFQEVETEKARAIVRQAQMARAMEKTGSLKCEGLGQKMGSIDVRTFFRWHQQFPECWRDEGFIQKMLRDNRHLVSPGFTPKKGYKAAATTVYA